MGTLRAAAARTSGEKFSAKIDFFKGVYRGPRRCRFFRFAAQHLEKSQDLPLAANTNLKACLDRVLARPAVQTGLAIPEPFPHEKQFQGFIKATVGLGDLHA